MSVKFSKYIFKRIGSSIVPIRKGLSVVDDHGINAMAKALARSESKPSGLKKLGSGWNFHGWTNKAQDWVIKMRKRRKNGFTKADWNHNLFKQYPELEDKIAVHKALGDNLPNYGVPTEPSEIIRISKNKRGVLQRFVPKIGQGSYHDMMHVKNAGQEIKTRHGLDIDAHLNNIGQGRLVDTGGNMSKTDFWKSEPLDDAGKEILGLEGYWNTKVKDLANKSTVMSHQALLDGQSTSTLRKMNALKKKGFKLVQKAKVPDEYRFINPVPRPNSLSNSAVRFIRKKGRIIPIRVKNRN